MKLGYVCDRCAKIVEAGNEESLKGWKRLVVNDISEEWDAGYTDDRLQEEKHLCPACYKRIYEF